MMLISILQASYTVLGTQEEFEDIKVVIRIRKSMKDRQHIRQKKKYRRTNNDLRNKHIQLTIVVDTPRIYIVLYKSLDTHRQILK